MPDQPAPRFEDALSQLERIVESLERGEPALSTALAKFEDGVRLSRLCHQILDQAERSVALLTGVDDQGNPLTTPFDSTATLSREPGAGVATSPTDARPPTPSSDELGSPVRPIGPAARRSANKPSTDDSDPPF
jgi:exodeoxyribonuclease VII small subunit